MLSEGCSVLCAGRFIDSLRFPAAAGTVGKLGGAGAGGATAAAAVAAATFARLAESVASFSATLFNESVLIGAAPGFFFAAAVAPAIRFATAAAIAIESIFVITGGAIALFAATPGVPDGCPDAGSLNNAPCAG